LDVPEVGNLLAQLRQLQWPEARYHEANLLLANGHLVEALEILEKASQGNFTEPYYLPGYLLARLGQLYDLKGERKAALRCYKGVRALSYAPLEALAEATKGLERPFELPRAKAG
jgi:tetratricopeptide (TPR) repeat protein